MPAFSGITEKLLKHINGFLYGNVMMCLSPSGTSFAKCIKMSLYFTKLKGIIILLRRESIILSLMIRGQNFD